MGIFKRIAGFLGFSNDDEDDNNNNIGGGGGGGPPLPQNHPPRKGFSVPVQVAVSRDPLAPLLVRCFHTSDGGVQGLRWYAKRLRIDEDGDVADEFLNEILPDTPSSTEEKHRKFHRFELKYSTKPAKVTSQALLAAGKIKHHVEYQGRLEWI